MKNISPPVRFIFFGLLAFLLLRNLPPDSSWDLVRDAGTLKVCHPTRLEPYINNEAQGMEAEVMRQVAGHLKVDITWNMQPGWGTTPDPVDWGMRPESCDVVIGGIVVSQETRALMQLLPYRKTQWSRVGELKDTVGVYAPFWGLDRTEAFAYLNSKNLESISFDTWAEAQQALNSGQIQGLMSFKEALATLNIPTKIIPDLPSHTLAVGLWKTRVTLKRALEGALKTVLKE